MEQNELSEIADLLNEFALIMAEFADLAEAYALESYMQYQQLHSND